MCEEKSEKDRSEEEYLCCRGEEVSRGARVANGGWRRAWTGQPTCRLRARTKKARNKKKRWREGRRRWSASEEERRAKILKRFKVKSKKDKRRLFFIFGIYVYPNIIFKKGYS